ncbi:hypothetical protein T07_4843 [Trichinella nelsoni]|uniref:PiggyBac transposable element-derived protein 3 n=1 Tax=Trichinella nelsoni TaxID=6336 RepID=A0A0V0RK07_9BILA|nr:hypothetical protein T07_4843 [Trichinella nelsoni]
MGGVDILDKLLSSYRPPKPRLTILTGRRAHPPETLRITQGHYLEPISQGRCRDCKKNCRLHCVECRERLHS